jgi:hypothetical protein
VPVILMSGYTREEVAADPGPAAAGFLQKPFLPEDLSGLLQLVSESTPA